MVVLGRGRRAGGVSLALLRRIHRRGGQVVKDKTCREGHEGGGLRLLKLESRTTLSERSIIRRNTVWNPGMVIQTKNVSQKSGQHNVVGRMSCHQSRRCGVRENRLWPGGGGNKGRVLPGSTGSPSAAALPCMRLRGSDGGGSRRDDARSVTARASRFRPYKNPRQRIASRFRASASRSYVFNTMQSGAPNHTMLLTPDRMHVRNMDWLSQSDMPRKASNRKDTIRGFEVLNFGCDARIKEFCGIGKVT